MQKELFKNTLWYFLPWEKGAMSATVDKWRALYHRFVNPKLLNNAAILSDGKYLNNRQPQGCYLTTCHTGNVMLSVTCWRDTPE